MIEGFTLAGLLLFLCAAGASLVFDEDGFAIAFALMGAGALLAADAVQVSQDLRIHDTATERCLEVVEFRDCMGRERARLIREAR